MLGKTRVRILAQHLGGTLRRATMTLVKGHSIVFPVRSHEKKYTEQNKIIYLFKKIFMATLNAFSKDSDEVLAWNLIMHTVHYKLLVKA
jgi:hypothetical protein